MSSQLPSTITVYVDSLEKAKAYRPFDHHPALTIALSYIGLLVTSTVLTTLGTNGLVVASVNILALIVPAAITIFCYSKPLSILRDNARWEAQFLFGLQMEFGQSAKLTNSAEVLIALRSGEDAYADVSVFGRRKTYKVAANDSEIVLFSHDDIDRDWALMNAQHGY